MLNPRSSSEAPFFSGFFYQQILSREGLSIERGSSPPAFPLCGHLHKGNASRLAGLSVLNNLDRHNISRFGEKGFEFRLGGLVRKVGYVNFLVRISSLQFRVIRRGNVNNDFLPAAPGI